MWNSISASQIKTHQDCNRKWFFEKIVFPKEENEGSASTRLGTEVHACIENYLNGEGLLDHPLLELNTYVAKVKGRSDLDRRVEWEFSDTSSFKVTARGFIDLVLIDWANKHVTVMDHKTTKDWRYAKKEDELRVDAQLLLYMWVVLQEFGPEWKYTFGHHVILTKEPAPERVTLVDVSVAEIIQGKALLDSWVSGMIHDSRALDHTFVDKDYGSCYKYGKCAFWDYCKGEKKVPALSSLVKTVTSAPPEPPVESVVLIDAIPVGEAFTWYEEWVSDLVAAYEKEIGEHYMATKYNEGCKQVALQAHKEVMEGKRTLPRFLVLRSTNPSCVFFENFYGSRKNVVKGIR